MTRGRASRLVILAAASLVPVLLLLVISRPLPPGFGDLDPHASTLVVDRHGERLYETLSDRETRSRGPSAADLPRNLVLATLAAEDHRFYSHFGVDPIAVLRAAWRNVTAGALVEGGSTLTQQAVKQLIRRERTLAAKLREMSLALRLERAMSKDEILALYLDVAPYGAQIVGAEAASQSYFGVPAARLTLAQAALLAGLPQAPSSLDPWRHPERAVARGRVVLGRLAGVGMIDARTLRDALDERLRFDPPPRSLVAPHFVERVLAEVSRRADDSRPRRIQTTLDAGLQRRVSAIVTQHRLRLEELGARHVAVGVLDNQRAEWLAWEGSGGYASAEAGRIDGVVAPRQPGSALKPFTYALGFERGFTPASVLPDVPSHFPTALPGVLYSPRNYDGRFRGPLRARLALAGSENVPAVWLIHELGVPDLLGLLRAAGLSTLDKSADHYGVALTMGDAEVQLDELVSAYAMLARGGVAVAPRLVQSVAWNDGPRDASPGPPGERLLSERAAWWVADILSDDEARAWSFGAGSTLDFPFPVAVKTGTSQSYRDNWTLGFTKDVTVGVWVGNFDRTPLRHSPGAIGAGPLFHDVLLAAQRHVAGRLPADAEGAPGPQPADLVEHPVCALSGLGAGPACPVREIEWLSEAALPPACDWHGGEPSGDAVRWPTKYAAWAATRAPREGSSDGAWPVLVAGAPSAATASAHDPRIVSPPDGASYLLDTTLRPGFQSVPLRAVAPAGGSLAWSVNGAPVGVSPSARTLDWPLERGRHVILATDRDGRVARASIDVR